MIRRLIVAFVLLLPLPAHAALTFLWGAEGTTLSGTDDFSAGDTTATANGSVSISATAAMVGASGILGNSNEHYRFDTGSIANRLTGAMAGWMRIAANPSTTPTIFMLRGSAANDFYIVSITGNWSTSTGEIRLVQQSTDTGGSQTTVTTTGAMLSLNTWYFVVAKWDHGANLRRIEVYNSDGSPRANAENTSAYVAPLDLTLGSGIRLGESTGGGVTYHLDNIFIGDAYADGATFLTNRNITSYTEYSAGGGGTVVNPISGRGGAAAQPITH